jgi:TrmH family RNA methyltransferase
MEWRARWSGLVVGAHLSATENFRDRDYGEGPVLLLMGNEQQGLTPALTAACDRLYRIPMAGAADSLNLAVATALLTYEIRHRHLPQSPEEAR